jgi:hypothetical protein
MQISDIVKATVMPSKKPNKIRLPLVFESRFDSVKKTQT